MKKSKLFLLTLLLICTQSCSKDPGTYTVEEISGIKHVHNLSTIIGENHNIVLEFANRIGVIEGGTEEYQLFHPRDALIDSRDNIYILDTGNNRIQKYDRDGKFLLTIGGYGQGPGEFISPQSFCIDSQDNLYVVNAGQKAIHVFDQNGKFLRMIRHNDSPVAIRVQDSRNMVFFDEDCYESKVCKITYNYQQ
ncbi:NHL repeat-containing protein [candidate division KSB1 bacterium]